MVEFHVWSAIETSELFHCCSTNAHYKVAKYGWLYFVKSSKWTEHVEMNIVTWCIKLHVANFGTFDVVFHLSQHQSTAPSCLPTVLQAYNTDIIHQVAQRRLHQQLPDSPARMTTPIHSRWPVSCAAKICIKTDNVRVWNRAGFKAADSTFRIARSTVQWSPWQRSCRPAADFVGGVASSTAARLRKRVYRILATVRLSLWKDHREINV